MAKYYYTKDIIDALHYYTNAISTENMLVDFDKATDQIYRLIEKLIFRNNGNVHTTRERLRSEELEDYLDIYLDMEANTG